MPALHIKTLASARSCIAALADNARTRSGAHAYERVLLELDAMFGDEGPAIETIPDGESEDVHREAAAALGNLLRLGTDPLRTEILLALLESVREMDVTACTAPTATRFGPNSRFS